MKPLKPFVFLLLIVLFVIIVAFFLPLPIHANTDFSILYFANTALLNGIHLYNYSAQVELLSAFPGLVFTPYPYPPWYALATLPLAFLPVTLAARVWFLLNLSMAAASVWLLTPFWTTRLRLLAILGAIIYVPVFGLLVVGQYSMPVLLGAALFTGAARREFSPGIAASLGLMTFKPHIGIFLSAAALGWLLYHHENKFARQALFFTALLAVGLFAVGFLADSAWPLTYFQSLTSYRDIPGVQSCGLCASLSVELVRLFTGRPKLGQAVFVSAALFIGLSVLYFYLLRSQKNEPAVFMALSIIFTLLVYPYLLNYDFILLLLPFAVLSGIVKSLPGRAIVLTAYLLPWGLLIYGREANFLLALSAFLLLLLFWKKRIF